MIHLVTHYICRRVLTDQWVPMAREHNRKWAEKLGWNFIADSKQRLVHDDNGPLPKGMMIYREKSAILAEKIKDMSDGDRVLWLDGDAVIVRDPSEIFEEIKGYDLGMSKFKKGRWNGGVIPFHVNPATRELWPSTLTHEHNSSKNWMDMATGDKIGRWLTPEEAESCGARKNECATCPRDIGDRTPICTSGALSIADLDRRYNEHFENRDENTKIIGLHMMSMSRTLRLMKEAIAWQPS